MTLKALQFALPLLFEEFVMHRIFALISIFYLAMSACTADQVLLLSAQQDKKIEVYHLNAQSGLPQLDHALELPANSGELALSPDGKKIYVALSYSDKNLEYRFGIATLAFDAEAKLQLLHIEPKSIGATHMACDPSGKFLICASYGDGKVTMLPIQADGICKGHLIEQRSTDDNAHCVAISKDGRYALVPHTGPNAIYQFRINAPKNRLEPNSPALVSGPANHAFQHEPRHLRFHPSLNAVYTSNERGGGFSQWDYDPFFGTLSLQQTVSTTDHPAELLNNFAAADCQISPDGRFAYVTNRDNSDLKSPVGLDSISAFELNTRNGHINKRVGIYPTGRHPRVMSIEANGKYLYCAGRNSSDLSCYRIEKDGSLSLIEKIAVGKSPMGLMCMSPKF